MYSVYAGNDGVLLLHKGKFTMGKNMMLYSIVFVTY